MHEISIEHDLDWVDCADQEEAHEFRAELGHDKCDIRVNEEGQWKVRLKRGAVLAIPKALQFDRTVAGQIPTGWDPVTLGIPADIVEQVDPVTLFTLVATAEALMCAGLPNAYEMYKYVHVTEVGNTSGGGMGKE
jgi:fatty acid synthase subunit alpha, fungi type